MNSPQSAAMQILARASLLLLVFEVCACSSQTTGESIASRSAPNATSIPAIEAKPEYWLDREPSVVVDSIDFERLWNSCDRAARDFQFTIDRSDYRQGLLTTQPMISKQFFEFWRSDTATLHDTIESSLQTIRRTIQIRLTRGQGGVYTAAPKVLIERLSLIQRRITSVSESHYVFSPIGPGSSFQTAAGITVPTRYWYAIGRDEALEHELAKSIEGKLRDH